MGLVFLEGLNTVKFGLNIEEIEIIIIRIKYIFNGEFKEKISQVEIKFEIIVNQRKLKRVPEKNQVL